MSLKERTEAIEIVHGSSDAPVVVTCEHASQRMPHGFRWPDRDRRLIDTHWAYDLGARELALDLARVADAPAILSRFSRLLIDPNRPIDSPTLFRERAEGELVELNTILLDAQERTRRIERLWRPYHDAIEREIAATRAPLVFSMHTFTPLYEGQKRELEVGVLFDREEELALRFADALGRAGFRTALNEPYSGKGGLMYAVETHAHAHGRRALELEVRQDLATDPAVRSALVACIAELVR
jgi:predicted N-formylglutamate amidohydrolase